MSEIVREALMGATGKIIESRLLELASSLDKTSVTYIRNGEKSYSDVRYNVGVSDGLRLAINAIKELAHS